MNKQTAVNPHNRMLLCNKKEQITDTIHNKADASQMLYAKWKNSKAFLFYSHDIHEKGKLWGAENRSVMARCERVGGTFD